MGFGFWALGLGPIRFKGFPKLSYIWGLGLGFEVLGLRGFLKLSCICGLGLGFEGFPKLRVPLMGL